MPVSSTPSSEYPFWRTTSELDLPGSADLAYGPITLPGDESYLRFGFQLDMDVIQGEEFIQVGIVVDGGDWTAVETNLSNQAGLSVYGASPGGGQPAYSASGSTGGWLYTYIDLVPYAGSEVYLSVRYTGTTTSDGVAVDTLRYSHGEAQTELDGLVGGSGWESVPDPATEIPDSYAGYVSLTGSPVNGGSNNSGIVEIQASYHYATYVGGSSNPSGSTAIVPDSISYTLDGSPPVSLTPATTSTINIPSSSPGSHSLTLTAVITLPDNTIESDSASYTWTIYRSAPGGGWDWTAPASDTDPWAGVDIDSAGIQVNGKNLTAGGSGSAVLSVTSFEGQWSIPGLKGSEIDLEGLTGVIPVSRLSQVGSFTLPLELDADTVIDFYREFDLVNALAGEQNLSIRVLRPTGEIRYQDNCSLPNQVDWTVVDANLAANCSLAFSVPYPYWRSGEKVSITVAAGDHDLTDLAGSNARNELLTLTCLAAGRLTCLDTGSYIEAPSGAILDCAKTSGNLDIRPLRRNPDFARLFVLGHRGGTVPRVRVTGSWKIEGYKRYKTA